MLLGGAITNGLTVFHFAEQTLGVEPQSVSDELERRVNVPPNGPIAVPLLRPERFPYWQSGAGVFIPDGEKNNRLDVYLALTEAPLQRLAQALEALTDDKARENSLVVASGGILNQPRSHLQRMADILGVPVGCSEEPQAGIRGAAAKAASRLGVTLPAAKLGRMYFPRKELTEVYRQRRQRMFELEEQALGHRLR